MGVGPKSWFPDTGSISIRRRKAVERGIEAKRMMIVL
jgi:hypothetical protein